MNAQEEPTTILSQVHFFKPKKPYSYAIVVAVYPIPIPIQP